jgi:archaellum biogenesis ATPase FlaH
VTKIPLQHDLFNTQSTLILIPSNKYNEIIATVPQQISGSKICYITLNKTYNALIDLFGNNPNIDLNNFIFIDGITKSIGKVENQDNCYYVSSPQALTELSIVVAEFLKYQFDYVIVDSLTTLLIYQKSEEAVLKFLSNLVHKIKESGSRGIFYALNISNHNLLIQESSMITDKIIDLDISENMEKMLLLQ